MNRKTISGKKKRKGKHYVDCHKLDGIIRLFIDNA